MNKAKWILLVVAALFLTATVVNDADAWRRNRSYSSSSVSSGYTYTPTPYSTDKVWEVTIDGEKQLWSLQQIAQCRADAMASERNMTHSIHNYVKNVPPCPIAEVIGYATGVTDYKKVATCVCGNTVFADAYAISEDGKAIYRVRFWVNK
jgi:hypothetical protein